MNNVPDGAQLSEDGYWWWDGEQWQPVNTEVDGGGEDSYESSESAWTPEDDPDCVWDSTALEDTGAWKTSDQGHVEAASRGWLNFWAVWCEYERCFVERIWFDEYRAQQDVVYHKRRTSPDENNLAAGHPCRAVEVEMDHS